MSSTWIRWQCFNLAVYCSLEALFSAGLGLKLICEWLNIYTVIEYQHRLCQTHSSYCYHIYGKKNILQFKCSATHVPTIIINKGKLHHFLLLDRSFVWGMKNCGDREVKPLSESLDAFSIILLSVNNVCKQNYGVSMTLFLRLLIKNQFSNTTDSCAKLRTTAIHTACSSWITLTKGNF